MFGARSNIPQVQQSFLKVAKQLPFAMSRSLNGIALAAQAEIRQELPLHFTVRAKTFLEQSVKWIQRATKQNLISILGVAPRPRSGIDQALALQEFGGEHRALSGAVAEPLRGARPTPQTITPPSKWPGKLKRKFTITSKRGDLLVLQRSGKSRKVAIGQDDPNVKVMYRIRKMVPVRKRWNFVATCIKVAKRDFPKILAKEWADAIRTAK